MGWGELRRPNYSRRLADAVRSYLSTPTTGNRVRMESALEDFDEAQKTTIFVHVDGSP